MCSDTHQRPEATYPFLNRMLGHVYPATSNMVEATDRFGSVLTLRLVRRGDSATTGSVFNRLPSKMGQATTGGIHPSLLYPQGGNGESKTEGLGTPSLDRVTARKSMRIATADKYQGGSIRSPAARGIRTSGASARISSGTQSQGGYITNSRMAPSRTVGAGTGIAAKTERNKHNAPPGLKLLGGLADEAGEDVLEVRSSVVTVIYIYANPQVHLFLL